jgi:glyoxylase-like metal-dependent hydrolase (beta-lactamase superfamily II)
MNEQQASTIQRVEGTVMAVNSYVLHGPEGLVVIDAQLAVSDAAEVRAVIDTSRLPLAGVVITHPHPDHYAGAAVVVRGDDDVPIVATAAVDRIIRRDDTEKGRIVGPMIDAEWPTARVFPNRLVESGAAVSLGGLTLTVRDLGAGESHADTWWELGETAVFAGDVAYNGMHAYLADGRYGEWIDLLDSLDRSLPDGVTLCVGHGEPGSKQLLTQQRRYVEAFVDEVHRSADASAEDRAARVAAAMQAIVPGDELLFLMRLSIEPVLATVRGESARTAASTSDTKPSDEEPSR